MNSIIIVSSDFIGYIDYLGMHFETNYIASSLGKYNSLALIRERVEN